jgi:hypothetical protein
LLQNFPAALRVSLRERRNAPTILELSVRINPEARTMKKLLTGIVTAAALAVTPALAYADDAPGQVADANTASVVATGSGVSTYIIVGGVVVLLTAGLALALTGGNSGTKSTTATIK